MSETSDRKLDTDASENAVMSHAAGSSLNNDETSALPSTSGVSAASGATDDLQDEYYFDSREHGPLAFFFSHRQARDAIKGTKQFS